MAKADCLKLAIPKVYELPAEHGVYVVVGGTRFTCSNPRVCILGHKKTSWVEHNGV